MKKMMSLMVIFGLSSFVFASDPAAIIANNAKLVMVQKWKNLI